MTRPDEQGDTLNVIVLGTETSPGVVTLSGHERVKNWDIQAAKGLTGATSVLHGDPVGQFQASFYLASAGDEDPGEDDFTRWESFRKVIESTTNGAKPKALPIYHPDLAENHYTEVTNGGIGPAVHDGKGGKTYVVKFLEYKPPKKKSAAKATGAPGSAASPNAPPDPNAAAKAQLAGLLAIARQP